MPHAIDRSGDLSTSASSLDSDSEPDSDFVPVRWRSRSVSINNAITYPVQSPLIEPKDLSLPRLLESSIDERSTRSQSIEPWPPKIQQRFMQLFGPSPTDMSPRSRSLSPIQTPITSTQSLQSLNQPSPLHQQSPESQNLLELQRQLLSLEHLTVYPKPESQQHSTEPQRQSDVPHSALPLPQKILTVKLERLQSVESHSLVVVQKQPPIATEPPPVTPKQLHESLKTLLKLHKGDTASKHLPISQHSLATSLVNQTVTSNQELVSRGTSPVSQIPLLKSPKRLIKFQSPSMTSRKDNLFPWEQSIELKKERESSESQKCPTPPKSATESQKHTTAQITSSVMRKTSEPTKRSSDFHDLSLKQRKLTCTVTSRDLLTSTSSLDSNSGSDSECVSLTSIKNTITQPINTPPIEPKDLSLRRLIESSDDERSTRSQSIEPWPPKIQQRFLQLFGPSPTDLSPRSRSLSPIQSPTTLTQSLRSPKQLSPSQQLPEFRRSVESQRQLQLFLERLAVCPTSKSEQHSTKPRQHSDVPHTALPLPQKTVTVKLERLQSVESYNLVGAGLKQSPCTPKRSPVTPKQLHKPLKRLLKLQKRDKAVSQNLTVSGNQEILHRSISSISQIPLPKSPNRLIKSQSPSTSPKNDNLLPCEQSIELKKETNSTESQKRSTPPKTSESQKHITAQITSPVIRKTPEPKTRPSYSEKLSFESPKLSSKSQNQLTASQKLVPSPRERSLHSRRHSPSRKQSLPQKHLASSKKRSISTQIPPPKLTQKLSPSQSRFTSSQEKRSSRCKQSPLSDKPSQKSSLTSRKDSQSSRIRSLSHLSSQNQSPVCQKRRQSSEKRSSSSEKRSSSSQERPAPPRKRSVSAGKKSSSPRKRSTSSNKRLSFSPERSPSSQKRLSLSQKKSSPAPKNTYSVQKKSSSPRKRSPSSHRSFSQNRSSFPQKITSSNQKISSSFRIRSLSRSPSDQKHSTWQKFTPFLQKKSLSSRNYSLSSRIRSPSFSPTSHRQSLSSRKRKLSSSKKQSTFCRKRSPLPRKRSRSFPKRSPSSRKRSPSSRKRSRSSRKRSPSSRKRSPSSRKRLRSSRKRSPSSRRRSPSSRKRLRSSRKRSPSARKRSPSARKLSRSSRKKSRKQSTSSRKQSTFSRKRSKFSRKKLASSRKRSKSSRKQSISKKYLYKKRSPSSRKLSLSPPSQSPYPRKHLHKPLKQSRSSSQNRQKDYQKRPSGSTSRIETPVSLKQCLKSQKRFLEYQIRTLSSRNQSLASRKLSPKSRKRSSVTRKLVRKSRYKSPCPRKKSSPSRKRTHVSHKSSPRRRGKSLSETSSRSRSSESESSSSRSRSCSYSKIKRSPTSRYRRIPRTSELKRARTRSVTPPLSLTPMLSTTLSTSAPTATPPRLPRRRVVRKGPRSPSGTPPPSSTNSLTATTPSTMSPE